MGNDIAMIDIDGVLYPYVRHTPGVEHDTGAFAEVVSKLMKRPITELSVAAGWMFFRDQWGLSMDEFWYCMREGTLRYDLFNRQIPCEGMSTATELYRLRNLGVKLHLVTNRVIEGATDEATTQTKAWLTTWGIPFDALIVSRYKVANGHAGYRWSIDDNIDNYNALDEAACNPYFLTSPWNVDHPGRRVDTLKEFVDTIEKELRP